MKKSICMLSIICSLCMALSVIGLVNVSAETNDAIAKPIAHYEFSDSSDFGKDSTGHFDLQTVGTPSSGTGTTAGRGVYFDGSSKLYASTDSSGKDFSDYLYDFTVSFWVYDATTATDTTGGTQYAALSTGMYGTDKGIVLKTAHVGDNASHYIYAIANEQGVYQGYYDTWQTAKAWHHIVFSVSNTNKQIRLYFDGAIATGYDSNNNKVNIGEIDGIGVDMLNTSDVFSLGAGSYNGGSNSWFTGYIDDVVIYDFAADSTNVTSLYNHNDILQTEVPDGVATIDSAEVVTAVANAGTSDSNMKKLLTLSGKTSTTVTYGGASHDVSVVWGTETDRTNEGYALVDGIAFINGVSNYNVKIKAKVSAPSAYALPLLWYKFNDSSNIGKDSMGNFDLTSFGTIGASSEGGASFDGASCLYLEPVSGGHDLIDELTSFTISFSAKSSATDTANRRIVSHGYCGSNVGFALVQNPYDNCIHFPVENSATSDSNSWWVNYKSFNSFNSWHNYSIVFSPSLAVLYVDGEAIMPITPYDGTKSLTAMSEYFAFAVGGSYHIGDTSVSNGFIGSIRDLRIYDFAMSSDEVVGVYCDSDMSATGTGVSTDRETIASYVVLNASSDELLYAKYNSTNRLQDVTTEQSSDRYYGKIKMTSNKGNNKTAKVLWCSADDSKITGFIVDSEYNNTSSISVSIDVKVEIGYTLNDGKNNDQNKIAYSVGETVTLQNPTKDGSQFIGWKIGNELKKPQTSFTFNDNTSLEAIFIEFRTIGASIRCSEPSGLRFENKISLSDYNAIVNLVTESNITLGTLIIPSSLIGETELTISTSDVLNIVRTKWKEENNEGYNAFSAVLLDIPEAEYKRELTARAYITVKYADDSTATYYGNTIARSISSVATSALGSGEYTDETIVAMLNKYKGE